MEKIFELKEKLKEKKEELAFLEGRLKALISSIPKEEINKNLQDLESEEKEIQKEFNNLISFFDRFKTEFEKKENEIRSLIE